MIGHIRYTCSVSSSLDIDKIPVKFTCTDCGNEFEEAFGRLKDGAPVNCPDCDKQAQVDLPAIKAAVEKVVDQFRAGIASLEDEAKNFNKP